MSLRLVWIQVKRRGNYENDNKPGGGDWQQRGAKKAEPCSAGEYQADWAVPGERKIGFDFAFFWVVWFCWGDLIARAGFSLLWGSLQCVKMAMLAKCACIQRYFEHFLPRNILRHNWNCKNTSNKIIQILHQTTTSSPWPSLKLYRNEVEAAVNLLIRESFFKFAKLLHRKIENISFWYFGCEHTGCF